jgi:low affinity Fe/Cu permease
MQLRNGNWQKIWKLVTNPAVNVIVVIAVVLISAWIVIETESAHRKSAFPVAIPIAK